MKLPNFFVNYAVRSQCGELICCIAWQGTFDSALIAYGWNLENQSALPVFVECQARGIEINIAGALYFGGYGHIFDPLNASRALQTKMARWQTLGKQFGGYRCDLIIVWWSLVDLEISIVVFDLRILEFVNLR